MMSKENLSPGMIRNLRKIDLVEAFQDLQSDVIALRIENRELENKFAAEARRVEIWEEAKTAVEDRVKLLKSLVNMQLECCFGGAEDPEVKRWNTPEDLPEKEITDPIERFLRKLVKLCDGGEI